MARGSSPSQELPRVAYTHARVGGRARGRVTRARERSINRGSGKGMRTMRKMRVTMKPAPGYVAEAIEQTPAQRIAELEHACDLALTWLEQASAEDFKYGGDRGVRVALARALRRAEA